ncbi:MAG: hypothetical protein KAW51_07160 [Candidatus Lokiarchaeota archaeon]|nr:hypothetical protein [Candidatus Lokiarchaeota archaeon]
MAQSEDSKNFSCPKCGKISTITFLKADGDKIIVKQKCPKHGERTFKVPLIQKDNFIPHFRQGVFRCYQCGQEAIVESTKTSGPWMLVKCACPTHGNKLPLQKIWSTIYTDISQYTDISLKESPESEHIKSPPIQTDEKKFCPDCGTPLKETGDFCDTCGSKIV